FNSRETADNLKKGGAFIPGIRPGQQTGEYIDKVLTRLTVWGALYVTLVCLLPEILMSYARVPFYFGGTSLLIMVVVVMDFVAQLHAPMVCDEYGGLRRRGNLRGPGKRGPGDEGLSMGQEDWQERQDRAAQGRRARHLLVRRPPQAARGLSQVFGN